MAKTPVTLAHKRIGRKLKAMREATGKEVPDVAESGVVSESYLYAIEGGRVAVTERMAVSLASFYRADEHEVRRLRDFARQAATPGWWQEHGAGQASTLISYAALEADADAVETYQQLVVPGLLQTPAYARALEREGRIEPDDEAIEQAVSFRMERQRAAEERRIAITAIMDEGALQRQVGGLDVVREQVDHLLTLAAGLTVNIRILPWSSGAHPGDRGRFTILRFSDPDPDVSYVETHIGEHYLEDEAERRATEAVFARLLAQSVPIEELA